VDCQFVLVTNDAAVFQPAPGHTREAEAQRQVRLEPLQGVEEQHADGGEREQRRAYACHRWSAFGSTPITR
jgi:hypothetical protein